MPTDLTLIAFWAKKIAAFLILPPGGPLLLIGFGLLVARARWMSWLGWFYALAVSVPITVNMIAEPLEAAAPVSLDAVRRTGAIVILGAGTRSYAPEYGGSTLNALALERVRYGARLAKATGRPVLVSGGAPENRTPEAWMMRDALRDDFGVTVRWVEASSRDTRDNATDSARLLRAAGIDRITLVTHAAHMPRAQAAFEAAGLTVTAAPTAWLSNPDPDMLPGDFLPNARAAFKGWYAVHEWVGGLAYRLTAPPPTAVPARAPN